MEEKITCSHCGAELDASEEYIVGDDILCENCADNLTIVCESCGERVYVENYAYKPDPIFYGDGDRFFGVELEVDKGYKDDDKAHQLKSIANIQCERIYMGRSLPFWLNLIFCAFCTALSVLYSFIISIEG